MDDHRITQLLNRGQGELTTGQQKDIDTVYQRLKEIARIQRVKVRDAGFNTTALVNEAWLKSQKESRTFNDRNHFFAYCALAMRHILLNEARRNKLITYVEQPEQDARPILVESDTLLDLEKQLIRLKDYDARLEQVFVYKYFGDMEFGDIAEVLQLSERTVFRDWQKARAMLAAAMQ